jgi:hypothetical protein
MYLNTKIDTLVPIKTGYKLNGDNCGWLLNPCLFLKKNYYFFIFLN